MLDCLTKYLSSSNQATVRWERGSGQLGEQGGGETEAARRVSGHREVSSSFSLQPELRVGRGSGLGRRQMSAPAGTPPAHTAPGQTVTFPRISQWKVLDHLARATCHSKTTREGSVA